MITLGIDYGASNIGVAMVRNTGDTNEPLFAGTIRIDARRLREKVETRSGIRRLRRTRKTKKRRLRNLREQLLLIRIAEDKVNQIIRFCERRGYKSLFDDNDIEKPEEKSTELTYRFTRENFFNDLDNELKRILQDHHEYQEAFAACEKILNRRGDPFQEIRIIKIDNRGANRCAWEGCNRVTPSRDNALGDAIAQSLFNAVRESLKDEPTRRGTIKSAISELENLGKRIRGASGEGAKGEKKALRKKAREILRGIRDDFFKPDVDDEERDRAWKYIETGIINVMESSRGRNRYCHEHSDSYVQAVLSGKAIPFKKTISESDIISRREQIAYQKIWRYLEARVFPLAPEGIDRIVVERTAFDLLAGSWKNIQNASDQLIEEMYQQGPMYGFSSVSEMLREEFGGLCAYCGQPSETLMDCDHILPRTEFFFDSYLNIVPACPRCNSDRKGKRAISATSLLINENAYEAYAQYLHKKSRNRPLHMFHTIKKGALNLMRDPARVWEAERYLSLISTHFAEIVQTQRSPRPFARLLYSRLSKLQKQAPEIQFKNGRHTALFRTIAYPEFSKYEEKRERNTINHAIDALLLASALPDPRPIESKGISALIVKNWARSAKQKAPKVGKDGIPEIPHYNFYVDGFEKVDLNGYVEFDLKKMCWNQKDSMTHKQDPYGWSEKEQLPTKRTAAVDLYTDFKKEPNKDRVKNIVERVSHPALRMKMLAAMESETPGVSTAEAMKEWLRQSIRNSIQKSFFSNHPGDQARKTDLEKFSGGKEDTIPSVIGVKMFDTGVRGKIDLTRLDKQTGGIGHHYMTQPANRGVILAYPKKPSGEADTAKPCLAFIKQNSSLKPEGAFFKPLPKGLSEGIIFGVGRSSMEWEKQVQAYLLECKFHSYGLLMPGCVVQYKNGNRWFVRNFDQNADFKKTRLKEITGIQRTPFANRVAPLKLLT
jgi:hypothetical protein